MATIGTAFTSTLQVVTKTASTLTNTVDTIDTGVGMLNDFARNARRHQRLANAGKEVGFTTRLISQIARDQTQMDHDINQWLGTNSQLTADFNKNYAAVEAAVLSAKEGL
jgi:hypothetical protein